MTPPIFHPGCIINADAFTYDREGKLIRAPHAAVFEDDVEIHPLTLVQRGGERPTRIGKGTKVDAGCHIGHDVEIGPGCTIAAHSVIAGHVVLEGNVYLGIGVLVRPRIRIGKDALLGAGAVVVTNVPPNCIYVGNPARFLRYRFQNEPATRDKKWDGAAWA